MYMYMCVPGAVHGLRHVGLKIRLSTMNELMHYGRHHIQGELEKYGKDWKAQTWWDKWAQTGVVWSSE
jgi:hypothetical protein